MSQSTSGLYSVLSSTTVYRLFQSILGGNKARIAFVQDHVRAKSDSCILDVGCGPADILEFLPPQCTYWGFDISSPYIAHARKRFGDRGQFFDREFTSSDLDKIPSMDVVIATGLIHHLDDETAETLLKTISDALKPGGRLITLDGVFDDSQNPIARWLISKDRGQHVRTIPQYHSLFSSAFPAPQVQLQHRTWIPYTYCLCECIKPS